MLESINEAMSVVGGVYPDVTQEPIWRASLNSTTTVACESGSRIFSD